MAPQNDSKPAESKGPTRLNTMAEGGEVDELRAENARLKAELAEARRNAAARPNTRPKPSEPSYGLSEGQRADLELHGKTVSPFTGALQVGDGEPGSDPETVSQEEFVKAGKKE